MITSCICCWDRRPPLPGRPHPAPASGDLRLTTANHHPRNRIADLRSITQQKEHISRTVAPSLTAGPWSWEALTGYSVRMWGVTFHMRTELYKRVAPPFYHGIGSTFSSQVCVRKGWRQRTPRQGGLAAECPRCSYYKMRGKRRQHCGGTAVAAFGHCQGGHIAAALLQLVLRLMAHAE